MRNFGEKELREMLCFFLMFCHFIGSQSHLRKAASCEGSAAQDTANFFTMLWRKSDSEVKAILKLKLLYIKTVMFGRFFEVQIYRVGTL